MVRRYARSLLLVLAACGVGFSWGLAQTPARSAPTRPAAAAKPAKVTPFETVKIGGEDYVDVRDFAKRFGLKAAWETKNTSVTLSDARGVRFDFEKDQRDYFTDGIRVFLGDAVRLYKESLWISRTDIFKIIGPLLVPSDYLEAFPAGAPKVIVLDPGHGGIDPGTQNVKLKLNEKSMALDVVARLKKSLELRGWKVILARSTDKELSRNKVKDLLMRTDIANKAKADIFLSIHFNAAPDAIAGVETYSMTPQGMRSTGDYSTGDPMSKTVFPNNRFDVPNLVLGGHIHRALVGELKTPDRGFKRGRWGVLRMLECPGVLIECGYLSNDAEARRIGTSEWRQRIAEGIADGVQAYAGTIAVMRANEAK
ncbi:N-acetylmuramoyl-L-alanine amidase family protein [Oleiharenicola lentus]|uniref:N-acetylmuramoyl-L-alanine amidase family protein n=1 Tax=Oleiharenicola lentus TaxID=2508720 RepID=UPI003F679DE2